MRLLFSAEELPDSPLGVLSAPNLAGEIAAGHITGSVITSATPAINTVVHDLLHSQSLLKAEADRREVSTPLLNGLYGMLHEHRAVGEVFDDMMHTEQAQDVEFVTGR